ncbi:adenine deaminase C-terminal domain-containing protein [Streptomyces sp. NPDC088135]|uniref:adenine deaminase C-terminal domain-containing protein n=1 Tax=Streptomyces sp. NPDC088135 TaxID=3160993 RepID=UPI00341E0715
MRRDVPHRPPRRFPHARPLRRRADRRLPRVLPGRAGLRARRARCRGRPHAERPAGPRALRRPLPGLPGRPGHRGRHRRARRGRQRGRAGGRDGPHRSVRPQGRADDAARRRRHGPRRHRPRRPLCHGLRALRQEGRRHRHRDDPGLRAAPDDNNIICVGADRTDIALAVNHLSQHGGGQVVVENGEIKEFLPLPVAGIVSDLAPEEMAAAEDRLEAAARALGCELPSAFGFLIFLEITAIPEYAVTDLGVVNYHTQDVVDILAPAAG